MDSRSTGRTFTVLRTGPQIHTLNTWMKTQSELQLGKEEFWFKWTVRTNLIPSWCASQSIAMWRTTYRLSNTTMIKSSRSWLKLEEGSVYQARKITTLRSLSMSSKLKQMTQKKWKTAIADGQKGSTPRKTTSEWGKIKSKRREFSTNLTKASRDWTESTFT